MTTESKEGSEEANIPDEVLLSAPSTGTTARASSVLNRNTKLYGPKNALVDDGSHNCWNSDSTEEEQVHYVVDFGRTVKISKVKIQFQAGFAAETCRVLMQYPTGSQFEEIGEWETVDHHGMQTFEVESDNETSALKLTFEECTDFYGRVTLYRVEVWGHETTEQAKS